MSLIIRSSWHSWSARRSRIEAGTKLPLTVSGGTYGESLDRVGGRIGVTAAVHLGGVAPRAAGGECGVASEAPSCGDGSSLLPSIPACSSYSLPISLLSWSAVGRDPKQSSSPGLGGAIAPLASTAPGGDAAPSKAPRLSRTISPLIWSAVGRGTKPPRPSSVPRSYTSFISSLSVRIPSALFSISSISPSSPPAVPSSEGCPPAGPSSSPSSSSSSSSSVSASLSVTLISLSATLDDRRNPSDAQM